MDLQKQRKEMGAAESAPAEQEGVDLEAGIGDAHNSAEEEMEHKEEGGEQKKVVKRIRIVRRKKEEPKFNLNRIQPQPEDIDAPISEDELSDDSDVDDTHKQPETLEEELAERGKPAELFYPRSLEQSDEFTALLADDRVYRTDFSFLYGDKEALDRYVRLSMYNLLRWISQLKPSNEAAMRQKIQITMQDVWMYIQHHNPEYRTQYEMRVERILNAAGLSLYVRSKQNFDPDVLSKFFQPTFKETLKKCNCDGGDCGVKTEFKPWSSDRYCPCRMPEKRECNELCGCDPMECSLRAANVDEQVQDNKQKQQHQHEDEDEDDENHQGKKKKKKRRAQKKVLIDEKQNTTQNLPSLVK